MTPKNSMAPVHPGEVLREELDAIGLSASALAKAVDVPVNRITAILNGDRGITADTALRLGRYFDTTAQFWLNLQQTWQIRLAETNAGARSIERIVPRETEALRNAARAASAVTTASDATTSAFKTIQRNIALCDQLHTIERSFRTLDANTQLLRALEGPLHELRRAGVFDTTLRDNLFGTAGWLADYNSRFRAPPADEFNRLIEEASESFGVSKSFRQVVESMKTPWLDASDRLGSLERLVSLDRIGELSSRRSSFGPEVAEQLRRSLGDWRDTISWPESIWSDLGARAEFYVDLGFDADLTHLPAPAFHDATSATEVRDEPPSMVEAYCPSPPPAFDPDEEAALARTNEAHDRLQRLESQLRCFIDREMTDAFGSDWPTHRLPNGKCDEWKAKKDTADRSGAPPRPLIAYADFTDYVLVICRRDNWDDVFEPYFERKDGVRESFQRLYPVRNDTMHARPITQDDELLLYVEGKRLMRRIAS